MSSSPRVPFSVTLAGLYEVESAGLRAWLLRQWPGIDPARAEDAAHSALVALLEAPSRYGRLSQRELRQLLFTIAWRQVRAWHRRKSTSSEIGSVEWLERLPCGLGSPEARAAGAEGLRALPDILDRAAEAYGGNRVAELRQALGYKLAHGCSDRVAAERFGVHRSLVTRARGMAREAVGVYRMRPPGSRPRRPSAPPNSG